MAAEDDIIQRIVLEGDKTVIAQFGAIGAAGTAAFNKVGAASVAASGKFSKSGQAFADLVGGFRNTGQAAADAAGSIEETGRRGLNLAQTLRVVGRAAGVPELSKLGKTANALGKAFEVALPAIIIAGLIKLASAGAKAAEEFDNLAASLKVTEPQMAALQAIGNASGLSFEELGTSLKAVDDITKKTAENTANNSKEYAKLQDELRDTAIKADDLAISFNKASREGANSARDFAKTIRDIGQASLDSNADFSKSLRNLQEQRDAIINGAPNANTQRLRQLRDLDEQEATLRDKQTRDLQKAMEDQIEATRKFAEAEENRRLEIRKLNLEQDANIKKEHEVHRQIAQAAVDAERNATALEKLGITATDANGKLKKAPEVLTDIARALGSLSDPTKQLKIEQDLINAGIDRKLIPALRRGVKGFEELQKSSGNINPGFNKEQIKAADDFSIALGQVGDAASALFKQAGIAAAPAFIGVFNDLRDLLVDIRPGFVSFVKTLADFLAPALKLIVDVIKNFVVPAFQFFFKGLELVAGLINKVFGTKITGMDIFVAGLLLLTAAFRGLIIGIQVAVVVIGLLADKLSKVDWSGFSKNATGAFDKVKTFVTNVFSGIIKLATDTVQGIKNIWGTITGFFSTLWSNLGAGAKFIWDSIVGFAQAGVEGVMKVWNDVIKFFTDLWTSITDLSSAVWTVISDAAGAAVQFVIDKWTGLVQFFTDLWTSITGLAQSAWKFVSDQANTAVDFISGIFKNIGSVIEGVFGSVKQTILDVWNSVKDFIKPLTDFFGGGSGSGSGGATQNAFAGGGPIRGPGTSTSDSIPIWTSAGEWIMKAAAVKKYGAGFMAAINSLRFDPQGFAGGGMVMPAFSPQPRLAFADGGMVPSRKNVLNLTIGDQTFDNLSATDKTMDQLTRFATGRQIKSAGRKPSWHGG